MSNLEGGSAVLASRTDGSDSRGVADDVEVLAPRQVPLGGLRAMTVRRTIPAPTLPGVRLKERR